MYSLTIDGDLIQGYTHYLFQEGRFMKVPVIFGNDTNKGTIFTPKDTSSVAQANDFLRAQYPSVSPAQLAKINAMYMASPNDPVYPNASEYWRGVSNAYGEIRYICLGIQVLTASSKLLQSV
jgi:carboxylesterase type B